MPKRSLALPIVTLLAALTLAAGACGGDDDAEETVTPEAAPTAQPIPVAVATTEATSVPVPAEDALTTAEAVKILAPSVVQIVTEVLTMGFFNQPTPDRGVGTGVILDEEGHILTNNHVIAGAQNITVTLFDGESYPATVIGGDLSTDLAVIKIVAEGLRPATLGDSSQLEVGQDVIAIGHALGLPGGPTVSKGVVSALGRSIDTETGATIIDLIQTDTSINPGNSGGPLANANAEIVGINTAVIRGGQGIGFAINIDDAKTVAGQLMRQGFVRRGFLGISPVNVTPGLAMRLNLPVHEGILVGRVIRGTAAERAGLEVEDVIVQLGEEPIRNNGELSKFLIDHPPGETIEVVFYRGRTRMGAQITLGDRPQ